jgi:NitT/TauT family transport system permease protein
MRWATDGTLVDNIGVTLEELLLGFVLAFVAGVLCGWLLAQLPLIDAATRPYIDIFNALPRIGLAPLFILWFGLGITSKVMLIFSVVFFVFLLNAYQGVINVDRDFIRLAKSLGAGRFELFWHIVAPSAVPWLVSGLRLGGAYAVSAAVVGEFVASSRGIGFLMQYAASTLDAAGAFAGLTVLAVFAWLLAMLSLQVERRALRWQRAERAEVAIRNT